MKRIYKTETLGPTLMVRLLHDLKHNVYVDPAQKELGEHTKNKADSRKARRDQIKRNGGKR